MDSSNGNSNVNQVPRHIGVRILCGVLWFVPIYLVLQMGVGAVVGAIAGAGTSNAQDGYAAGRAASVAFFQAYGLMFFLGEVALTVLLSVKGILPGTGKWKKA